MQQIEEWARRAGIAGDEEGWDAGKCRAVEVSMTAFWAVLAVLFVAVGA